MIDPNLFGQTIKNSIFEVLKIAWPYILLAIFVGFLSSKRFKRFIKRKF